MTPTGRSGALGGELIQVDECTFNESITGQLAADGPEPPFHLWGACSPRAQTFMGLFVTILKNCGQDGDEGGWKVATRWFVEAGDCSDNME